MKINIRLALIIIGALVIVVTLGIGGFFLYQNQKNQNNGSQTVAADEVRKLVGEVGKLVDLPFGEDPTIATITDITKLSDQPFFQRAKNGDRVLIYTNARKAILYDPIAKKVIDIAPVSIGTQSAQQNEQSQLPKVVFKNGTETAGLTTKVEDELKKENLKFDVTSKTNAQKKDYEKSTVVVINESTRDMAESIANVLGVTIGDLPEGEEKVEDADILVILGKDAT